MSGVSVSVDVSVGELIDKIAILEIKAARLDDPAQRNNVKSELESLVAAHDAALPPSAELTELSRALKQVNERLWRIEDDIRDRERAQDFDPPLHRVGPLHIRLQRRARRPQAARQRPCGLAYRRGKVLRPLLIASPISRLVDRI